MAITTLSSRQVLVSSIDIPDVKEVGGWLAGGIFRNESYPGGVNYSPVGTPSFTNTMQSPGYAPNFLNGNFDYLNSGLSNMFSFINYGYYDLLVKSREKDVTVLEYTIAVETIDTSSSGGDGDSDTVFELGGTLWADVDRTKDGAMTIAEIYAMDKGYSNVIGSIASGSNVNIVGTLYNITTSESMTLEERVRSEVFGYARSTIVNQLASSFASKFATGIASSVLGGVLGALMNEAYEISVGLDIHFGLGGEYLYTDQYGVARYDGRTTISEYIGLEDKTPEQQNIEFYFSQVKTIGDDGSISSGYYQPNYDFFGQGIYSNIDYEQSLQIANEMNTEAFKEAVKEDTDILNMAYLGISNINKVNEDVSVFDTPDSGDGTGYYDGSVDWEAGYEGPSANPDDYDSWSSIGSGFDDWGADDGSWF